MKVPLIKLPKILTITVRGWGGNGDDNRDNGSGGETDGYAILTARR